MFLKKSDVSFFSFYFWKQKRLKTTKKWSKEEFKKNESRIHKRDFWWESVSFVFLCYMGLKHNTTMFRTPLKRELLLKRKENYNDKKKTNRETKTVEKTVYSPLYFFFFFCSWGSEGAGASPSPRRARGSWLRSLFDPSHTSLPLPRPFLSLSPSLSRPVSLTL